MPTVIGAPLSPFVRKVRVALAEKNVAYDLDPVIPFNPPADFRKVSPLGKIPAFRDGDRTLSDSSVICAFLEKVHPDPALYPRDPYDYARALWFEEFGDTALAQNLTGTFFFQRIVGPRILNQPTDEAVLKKAAEQDLPPLFDYLESQIGTGDALVGGAFSIADVGIGTQWVNARHAGFSLDTARWPKLGRYVDAVLSRPSFQKLIEEESKFFGKAA
jgi:glutathione S-transferase